MDAKLVDDLVKLTPLLLALLALIIPTAADRLKNKGTAPLAAPVTQGQAVDFSKEYVESVKERDARQEAELADLRKRAARCSCGAFRDLP
jgi:hypothetical protein